MAATTFGAFEPKRSARESRMITVAILGYDDDVLAVARAVRDDPRFRVVGIYDVDSGQAALREVLPGVSCQAEWESLLVAGPQVVLVGRERSPSLADDQLRKLVQAGVPLLFTQPPCEAILALELEMIRRDSKAPLAVYYPGCRHETRARLARVVLDDAEPSIGRLEQVLVTRHLADRGRDGVTRQFARDVHWIQALVGDIRQVSALATGQVIDDVANLNVQMTTESGSLVRWSVHPRTAGTTDSIELVGTTSHVVLRMPWHQGDWQITDGESGESTSSPPTVREALEILVELPLAGENRASSPAVAHDWPQAVRALEVLDSVQVSLKRGRTVELQKTQLSEHNTFKGMMSAAGCLLLLLAPLILIGAALIDRLQASFRPRVASPPSSVATENELGDQRTSPEPRIGAGNSPSTSVAPQAKPRQFPWLAIALAAPLVVFLLLQTFQLVFHGRQSSDPPRDS